MKNLIIIIIFLIYHSCLAQKVEWENTKNWTLYQTNGRKTARSNLDSLHHLKSILLDDSIIHNFLRKADIWPKDSVSVWMGIYTTTCKMADNTDHIIQISVYGGFFYDLMSRSYYSIAQDDKEKWLTYFHDSMNRLTTGEP